MSQTNTAEQLLPAQRAALYIRVSTDEQARKGFSLPAQKEALETYAKQNGYDVCGLYVDDGVSAHQKYTKRRGLMRLLEDVQAGKIDTVLFIKLDRWFRSIKEYYKVQEILDAHHVTWKTTMEQYGTGAQDIMMTNLMLTIAQAESDRSSDRIKFVFENKVARGEIINGRLPFGYKNVDKRMVIDEEKAGIVRDMFRHYEEHGSIQGTMRYMRSQHGLSIHPQTTKAALTNSLYKGEYRGNPNYCEPIIPPDEFDMVQALIEKRSIRVNPTGAVYIYSGILVCSHCGHVMIGRRLQRPSGKEYFYYDCKMNKLYRSCPHHAPLKEAAFEEWLLTSIASEMENSRQRWLMAKKSAPKSDTGARRSAIKKKLDKLKDLYVDDLITKEQYRADYDRYQTELAELPKEQKEAAPDFDALQKLLEGDFQMAYKNMERADRRAFWRSLIEKIVLDVDNQPTIYFKRSITN